MTSLNQHTRSASAEKSGTVATPPAANMDTDSYPAVENGTGQPRASFADVLRFYREDCGLSQSRLAAMAGYDHSHISRYESSTRNPTRDAVLNLSMAMGLNATDTDRLLASAGFMPTSVSSLLEVEPVVAGLYRLLSDPEADPEQCRTIRATVAALIGVAA